MFGKKQQITCDCCLKQVDRTMEVCIDCYTSFMDKQLEVCIDCYTSFMDKQPLETQVRAKMDKNDLKIVDEMKLNEKLPELYNYVELKEKEIKHNENTKKTKKKKNQEK